MPRLADLQAEFSGALTQPENPVPAGVVAPGGGSAARRFAVYRNNVIVSLTEALGRTFPAVRNLLGEEYFAALAREFIRAYPPKSPVLGDYGDDFGDFLDAFPPLASYPYLGDVARMERAYLSAYHAADAPMLNPERLAGLEGEQLAGLCFTLHPATRLVTSRWPVLSLFEANRGGDGLTDLSAGGESVLITRPELTVELSRLEPGAFVFFQALGQGEALGEASTLAIAEIAFLRYCFRLAGGLALGRLLQHHTVWIAAKLLPANRSPKLHEQETAAVMTFIVSFFVRLYSGFFGGLQRLTEGWLLGLAGRFLFAGVLFVYFFNSAMTKLGSGLDGLLQPTDGAYVQILPAMMEAVGYDSSQIPFMPYGLVVLLGTWAEIVLPVLIVIGLFTRAASLGFIVFILVMSYVDITGHHLDAATVGTLFDGQVNGLIADQRSMWIFLLLVLMLRGPGKISLDHILARWWQNRY